MRQRAQDSTEKRVEGMDELPMCKCTWTFLSIKQLHFLPSVFSLIWGENFGEKTFWWARGEKTRALPFIFFPPHPIKHTPKSFPSYFLSKVFHPLYSPPNKHTLKVDIKVQICMVVMNVVIEIESKVKVVGLEIRWMRDLGQESDKIWGKTS